MNCRNCSAAMVPVGGRTYFRCDHCGSFEFPQQDDGGVAVVGEATGHSCPICKEGLTTAAIHGHTICYCNRCRGFLTTNPDFSAILAYRREEHQGASMVPRSISRDELKRRICCPKCKRGMDTHPYGGGGNVVIDTCARCHLIWLDAGEMDTIARHRPREVLAPVEPMPVTSTPSREPETGWRWGWEPEVREQKSFWDLFW